MQDEAYDELCDDNKRLQRQVATLKKDLVWWQEACNQKMHLIEELAKALEGGQWARDDWEMLDSLKKRAKEAIK